MNDERGRYTIKGDLTMSKSFIAQYAAAAALATEGVVELDTSVIASIKMAIGMEHQGKGVAVSFRGENFDDVSITVYPVVAYGYVLPEVAWQLQENIKHDVEEYTGLNVEAVNIHIIGIKTKKP